MSQSKTICDICVYDFNEADRKSVALPCGHDFCLTCLVHMKSSGDHNCPNCRENWAEVEVEALPGMKEVEGAVALQKQEGDAGKKKGGHDMCKKHDLPYQTWCLDDQDFYCIKCMLENTDKKVELITDAIPLIKSNLKKKVEETDQHINSNIDKLEKIERKLCTNLNSTTEFIEVACHYKREIEKQIKTVRTQKQAKLKAAKVVMQYTEEIETVQIDVALAVKCKATLAEIGEPSEAAETEVSEDLLCNIASVYMAQVGPASPPSKPAFIRELQKASGSFVELQTEMVLAAGKLEEGSIWDITGENCVPALLALADRQPSVLNLISGPNERETLPAAAVAAIAEAARDCEVWAFFYDSFCKPEETGRDLNRLEQLIKNTSLRLTRFYGHVDATAMAMLPQTISRLGLAIGSAADARTVSCLRPWKELTHLAVSISCSVAAQDLKLLPSIPHTRLFFPGLTDAGVDGVRPAIESLVGDKELQCLLLPACQLTAAGACRLVRLLRGVRISGGVYIEASDPWRPGAEEKKSVEAEFRGAVNCGVGWGIRWR